MPVKLILRTLQKICLLYLYHRYPPGFTAAAPTSHSQITPRTVSASPLALPSLPPPVSFCLLKPVIA